MWNLIKSFKSQIFLIPNLLGYLRILLLPVFLVVFLRAETAGDYLAAAGILALSVLTDVLDGFVARKFHMESDLGKLLDPIADKLTQVFIVFCLATRHRILFALFALLIIKEFTQFLLGFAIVKRGIGPFPSEWYGKLSSSTIYSSMFFMIAIPGIPDSVVTLLFILSFSACSLSFFMYSRLFTNKLGYQLFGASAKKENNP